MRRIKDWLMLRFLPAWAKERVYEENKQLKNKIAVMQMDIDRLNAYIDGLETGIRAQRRVVINNEVRDK